MNIRSMLLAAGAGGVTMAVVSTAPCLGLVNCLLCAGLWGSGILAVWLYREFEKNNPGLSVGQGAIIGALAGVAGAVLQTIISLIFRSAGAMAQLSQLNNLPQAGEYARFIPRELLVSGGFSLIGAGCSLFLYIAFGAVGGLIATALIWKQSRA